VFAPHSAQPPLWLELVLVVYGLVTTALVLAPRFSRRPKERRD
jgi:hypothetical protein